MSTYTPIASVTLSSAQSSVTFSGIPQTYTDLVVVSDCSVGSGTLYFAYQIGNGSVDTGNNYSYTYLLGSGSAASSGRVSSTNCIEPFTNTGTNNRLNVITSFQNYANTTTYKTALTRHNSPSDTRAAAASVALWRSTSAINTIKIYSIDGNNFNANSTFNLYGVANASITNVAKATGGDSVYTDGTYWYHIFRSSGTFTPTQALTADYLVVAGGGGGGGGNGGSGAGAGGFRTSIGGSALSLGTSAYTVTVGAGGAGGATDSNPGVIGSNSVFSSITSTGGGRGIQANGTGGDGGSGGGNGAANSATTAGQGTAGQGNNGGISNLVSPYPTGGGGGAGAVGGAGTGSTSGNGGAGSSSSISGSSVTYAGGGAGGGTFQGASGGTGGSGGGGSSTSTNGNSGTTNTGSGGAGGSTTGASGGAGGSGIVIVRYAA